MSAVVRRRFVQVDTDRLAGWVEGFDSRHGGAQAAVTTSGFALSGADGASAEIELPFLPWVAPDRSMPGSTRPLSLATAAVEHVRADRTLLVLLVRRGGYGVGVLLVGAGADDVLASKVGGAYVQGRTAAGGWSQQRFARRRDNQVADLLARAVDVAVRLSVPALSEVAATAPAWLVTGGDAPLVDRVLADPRLSALNRLPRTARVSVADPKAAVVAQVGQALRRLRIGLVDPLP